MGRQFGVQAFLFRLACMKQDHDLTNISYQAEQIVEYDWHAFRATIVMPLAREESGR